MIGHVLLSAYHKGTLFSENNASYALMNGQLLSRTTYPTLSAYWPTGAYGSTSNTMVLPDLGGSGLYLRGHAYNNGYDPNLSTRTVTSGTLPVAPSGIGTIQYATMKSHIHTEGTQSSAGYTFGQGGGDGNPSYPNTGSFTSQTASSPSGAAIVSSAADAATTDLCHMKFFPYIRIA